MQYLLQTWSAEGVYVLSWNLNFHMWHRASWNLDKWKKDYIYIWHYYLDLPWWHNWYVIYWSENVLKGNHAIKLMASLIYLLCTCTDVDKCEKFQVTLEILKVLVEKKGNVTPYPHITSYHYPYINFIYDEAKKLPVALLWLSLKMVNLKNILKGTIVCQASTPVFK